MNYAKRCTYEFTKGAKKGTTCDDSCRGEFCFKHKPKTLERKNEYYKERNCNEYDSLVDRIKEELNKKNMSEDELKEMYDKYLIKQSKNYNTIASVLRTIRGIKLYLGDVSEEQLINEYKKTEDYKERYLNDIIGEMVHINTRRIYHPYIGKKTKSAATKTMKRLINDKRPLLLAKYKMYNSILTLIKIDIDKEKDLDIETEFVFIDD